MTRHLDENELLEFAYGELEHVAVQDARTHVQACTQCAQALREIQNVRGAFATLANDEAPKAGLESLLAYAEQHAARARNSAGHASGGEGQVSWRKWLAPFSSVAAVLLVGIVALRVLPQLSPEEMPAASIQADAPAPAGARSAAPMRWEAQERDALAPSAPAAAPPAAKKEKTAALPERPDARANEAPARVQDAMPSLGAGAAMPRRAAAAPASSASSEMRAATKQVAADEEALKKDDAPADKVEQLRGRIARGAQGAVLESTLAELCQTEATLSEGKDVEAACTRLMREFPQSRFVPTARTRLEALKAQ